MTLSALLLLQHVVREGERDGRRPLHVVGQIRRIESVQVCNYLIGACSCKHILNQEQFSNDVNYIIHMRGALSH